MFLLTQLHQVARDRDTAYETLHILFLQNGQIGGAAPKKKPSSVSSSFSQLSRMHMRDSVNSNAGDDDDDDDSEGDTASRLVNAQRLMHALSEIQESATFWKSKVQNSIVLAARLERMKVPFMIRLCVCVCVCVSSLFPSLMFASPTASNYTCF